MLIINGAIADLDPLLIANGITGIREMWGGMQGIVYISPQIQLESIPSHDIYLPENKGNTTSIEAIILCSRVIDRLPLTFSKLIIGYNS